MVAAPASLEHRDAERAVGTRTAAPDDGWGYLPALTLSGACGLLVVAIAGASARQGAGWAEPLFWAGLALLFVPCAARLLARGAARQERIGLVTLLGCGLYVAKVLLHSPRSFTYYDELQHWRTAEDIARSGRLFGANPLLPASPLYPGLENVTHALGSTGGLSTFAAGIIVVGAARVVFMLALFLFYEQIGRSAWIGGVAALVYMANPYFVFFDAQFAYESIALPIAALTLFAVARRARGGTPASSPGLTLAILLGLGATLTTHHLTGYALVTLLGLWAALAWLRKRARKKNPGPGWPALLGLVVSAAWLAYVARIVVGYLSPIFGNAVGEVLRLIAGEVTSRQLFRNFAGQTPPLWERLATYAAVVLILAGLPVGLLRIWRRYRGNAGALTLGLVALAYPASHLLRLTSSGHELAGRMSGFLFAGVGFALAAAAGREVLTARRPAPRTIGPHHVGARNQGPFATAGGGWRRRLALVAWVTVIFWGGVLAGWSPWMRLPGPYLVSADARSIESQSVSAAQWVAAHLGPDHRIAADRINRLLLGSYGRQYAVTNLSDRTDVVQVFFAPRFGPVERAILQQARVRYVIVDRRLSTGLPMVGVYFELGEPGTFQHTAPIAPAVLAKFDGLENVSRVFDSGDITIYDMGALTGAP